MRGKIDRNWFAPSRTGMEVTALRQRAMLLRDEIILGRDDESSVSLIGSDDSVIQKTPVPPNAISVISAMHSLTSNCPRVA